MGFSILLFIIFSGYVQAEQSLIDFKKQSTSIQPYIVELYTSQGCSSCPPAESWLSGFTERDTLWQDYFPLAFHVTYWDYIGWNDPFGQQGFSQRQYDHLNLKNTAQVYTPQFIINGEEWRGWFARDLLLGFNRQEQKVGILDVMIKDEILKVTFSGTDTDKSDKLELHLALVGSEMSTYVRLGENRNSRLLHNFTVLNHQVFESSVISSHWPEVTFNGILEDVNAKKGNPERLALVVWIERNGKAIQAVGDWLVK
ncbi:DUF1223 domain-containing protein [Shewanella sp. D64]|uniref:DUF1223 domain-containing protein n=1 Tax=unclassified Shewanella TaxID=196818 RepID=UPI0022BA2314|nr:MULTISPECIES: DUF1223 domain-containing protein [unclassified Shewanella]MEC4727427.1 DUF1223 domain-containing protein [Shewanella sp. D64]MEC4739582.1 DUF1223 domain-containing protein [Shewanella sp. E94]WBJ96035.1 DUF1223 domain-containing protein [Shewanella sp. MTB7]